MKKVPSFFWKEALTTEEIMASSRRETLGVNGKRASACIRSETDGFRGLAIEIQAWQSAIEIQTYEGY